MPSSAARPPPITLWPTIFPPTGSLTPLLTSTNPSLKIPALTTAITLLTPVKKFILAASTTAPSATAFTTPSQIALSCATSLSALLPSLLDETHPIALAKTARLAAELASCGLATPAMAHSLCEVAVDGSKDRTSRAAAASALVSAVDRADAAGVCTAFSAALANPGAPVAEMLAVLRVVVMDTPAKFARVWQTAREVLVTVLGDAAVGLHAVRLVHAFVTALLDSSRHPREGASAATDAFVEDGVLLPVVYARILEPAATSGDQPMQLSAISAIDAFQQLPFTSVSPHLRAVRHLLCSLSTAATTPVRAAALRALGNHPTAHEQLLSVIVATPPTPALPRAKAFSAAAALLEQMTGDTHRRVEGFVRGAVRHIAARNGVLSKPERTAEESLRVACLAFLGVAMARGKDRGEGEWGDVLAAVMTTAVEGSVNVRVHACKCLARVLRGCEAGERREIEEFLCSLLDPRVPGRVVMAAARGLLGMTHLGRLETPQKVSMVRGCVECSKASEGIGDAHERALRQALRRLLGELVVRVVEDGVGWRGGRVGREDLYDCVAVHYRLPGFLKDRFEQGDDKVLVEFPEEARGVLRRLLELRSV